MPSGGTVPNATTGGATAAAGATTAAAAATATAPATTTGTTTGTSSSGNPSGDQTRSVFVNGILLTERTLMPDSTWPADLILDRSKSNWEDWNLRLSYVVDRQAIDLNFVRKLGTAHEVYERLRKHHEQIGLHAQILLIKEALSVCFEPNTSLVVTANKIKQLWERIVKMGNFDNNKLLTVLLLNALTDNFPQLQSFLNGLLNEPLFSSDKVMERLEDEDSLQD
ncbi:hypothetical protein H4582DRAFT_2087783 [Lactarius indigo]|nr:hypothetical protein H4582DRAFT_2087783 [Lactarius indigo]